LKGGDIMEWVRRMYDEDEEIEEDERKFRVKLFCLDVDGSTAKRMRKYLDSDTLLCEELEGTVYHWSIYRHVEMMDKHLESRCDIIYF